MTAMRYRAMLLLALCWVAASTLAASGAPRASVVPGFSRAQAGTAQVAAFPSPADLETFRKNIELLFVRPRGGSMPGYAACVMCHTWQTSLRFSLETPETTQGWTPAQSRRNFDVVTQVINTADPESSRLLLKPLSPQAGGLGHTGGTYWTSKENPEYQQILTWIRSFPADRYVAKPGPPLDFEFFRACVQPIFANPREGHIRCSNCHDSGLAGFAPVPAGGGGWSDAQAKAAFQVISRLVIPGSPEQSRFLLKPLHPDGGGSYTHNGPRRWQSRSDPEWQMLAGWVRGERTGSRCS
ncbi:MAG: hypothetical protein A3H29_13860 [Acidobacteria bacterium RIFCSPLOWO2_02_FULL_67_21]|nr:MAG: hypothetical protein A3H29_13860 [Acidobacteria bacterium RIFCSPLOWO2_02_FULL_67_21]